MIWIWCVGEFWEGLESLKAFMKKAGPSMEEKQKYKQRRYENQQMSLNSMLRRVVRDKARLRKQMQKKSNIMKVVW